MDPQQLQAWLLLLETAATISTHVVDAIKHSMHRELTKEENEQVLAVWTDNAERSARNAGLPPEGDA